jgi:hypothetical protein
VSPATPPSTRQAGSMLPPAPASAQFSPITTESVTAERAGLSLFKARMSSLALAAPMLLHILPLGEARVNATVFPGGFSGIRVQVPVTAITPS